MDQSPGLPNNVEHVAFARLARDSGFELMLTFVLLFGVVSIVRWVIGPSPISRAIPGIHAELCIVGAAVGLLLAGLILSPPGRASGGHANPAISLAMWRFGVFPAAGVVPYAIAQLLGSMVACYSLLVRILVKKGNLKMRTTKFMAVTAGVLLSLGVVPSLLPVRAPGMAYAATATPKWLWGHNTIRPTSMSRQRTSTASWLAFSPLSGALPPNKAFSP